MPNNLATLRAKYHFSQTQLADRVGVAPLTLGRWERGEALPRSFYRQILCEVFECTEEDLAFSPQTLAVAAPASDMGPLYDAIIPLTPIELIGRETDLARIKGQLIGHTDGSVAVSALNGIPGVGKTSLAIAIAHDAEIRTSFSDGILWAALGPTPNIPGLLSRWAGLLGLSEAPFSKLDEDQKRRTLRRAFGRRSMLLVLDDVWRLDDALTLRVGGPNCASLLTTRFPVIASQMAVKDALLIEELDAEDSFHLLHTLAPEAVEYAPERVRALVQAVDGLPLALTLLGGYLRKHSYNVPTRRAVLALEHLGNARIRLQINELHVQAEAHPSIASSTPISLQSIIAVSDHFLTTVARETLYALSVFPPKPESFSEVAALMIAACTTHELDELVDAGLLESNGNRYRLHRIIADYARLQIDDQAEQRLTRRLIAYMQEYVESHAKEYESLEQEMTLLLYTLDKAVTGEAFQSQIVPLVCVSAPFLLIRGYYRETERFLDRAYEVALTSQDATDIAWVLLYLGKWYVDTDAFLQAEPYLREALVLAQQIDHRELICATLLTLTTVLREREQYAEAKVCLQEASTLAKELEIPRFICIALDAEGNLVLALRQGDAALLAFQEMRRLGPEGDFEVEALCFYGMARSYEQMGQCDQALSFGQQALVLVQQKKMGWYEQRIRAWYTRFLQPPTLTESVTCICGKTFVPPSGPGRTRQYCSERCASRARKRAQRQRKKG